MRSGPYGKYKRRAELVERDARIIQLFLEGTSQVEIAALYGFASRTTVQLICSAAGYGRKDGGNSKLLRIQADQWRDARYIAIFGVTYSEFVTAGRSAQPIADPGCQLWPGVVGSHGYGVLATVWLMHRQSYCDHHGVSEDDISGLVVRHRCDVPRCVNPLHLEIGTHADNNRDARERGRNGWPGHRPVNGSRGVSA